MWAMLSEKTWPNAGLSMSSWRFASDAGLSFGSTVNGSVSLSSAAES